MRLRSAAMESASHAIVITSIDGLIEAVNPAFEGLTGYNRTDALGQDMRSLYAGSADDRLYDSMWRSVKTGRVWQGELDGRRKDGSIYRGEMTVTPVRDQRGDISNYVAINQDITERRRAVELEIENASLSRSAQLKDEFLANMSHELRTPLNAVIGLSDVLASGLFGNVNDEQADSLEMINTSGKHLLELINDILDISKIAAGEFELEFAPLSALQVADSALRMIESAAGDGDITLVPDLDPAADSMVGDRRRILQILVNLLSNAVKFTPDGGRVGLQLRSDEGMIRFTVWDTGIGIDEVDFPLLFEPFVQIDSGLGRRYDGTGLGLSIVWRLAILHGGGVEVTSEIGHGSRFSVHLPHEVPVADPESPVPAPPPAEPLTSAGPIGPASDGYVLIVDGDPPGAFATSGILEARGRRTRVVSDGPTALRCIESNPPAAVVTDLQLPGLDGAELTRQIRRRPGCAQLPIIIISASALPQESELCLAAGADHYLTKPVAYGQLDSLLASRLGHPDRDEPLP